MGMGCQEVMVALSQSVIENRLKRPRRRNHDDVISGLQKASLSRKPCIPDKTNTMERYQYIICHENRLKRSLAEKSR